MFYNYKLFYLLKVLLDSLFIIRKILGKNDMNQDNETKQTSKVEDRVPLSVLFIMDGSGSIENMGSEPLDGLNKIIKQQKETGDFRFTLVVFDNEIKTVIDDMDGKDVPELTSEHYKPNGMTALLDVLKIYN